jgi:hypothetical protein
MSACSPCTAPRAPTSATRPCRLCRRCCLNWSARASLSVSLPRSRTPARPCRSRGRIRHGRPAKLDAARVLTALGPHSRSHVHHRLHLIGLHLARTLAQVASRRSPAARRAAAGEPLLRVAPPPRATSRRAKATCGCARAPSCSPTTPLPPTSFLRPPPAVSHKSSSVHSRPGTSRKNSTNSRGLTAQSVTQVNSALGTDS